MVVHVSHCLVTKEGTQDHPKRVGNLRAVLREAWTWDMASATLQLGEAAATLVGKRKKVRASRVLAGAAVTPLMRPPMRAAAAKKFFILRDRMSAVVPANVLLNRLKRVK